MEHMNYMASANGGRDEKVGNIPREPLGFHETRRARMVACSSGVGSGGAGAGYPLGKSVRFAMRTILVTNCGERLLYSVYGRSLEIMGIKTTLEIINAHRSRNFISKVVRSVIVVVIIFDASRSRVQNISLNISRGPRA